MVRVSLSRTASNGSAMSSGPAPPVYVPRPDAPSYSLEPSAEERRLAISHRASHMLPRTGTISRKSKGLAVVLTHQEEGATVPTYSREAAVVGEVHVERAEKIGSVSVKLEGVLELTLAEGGSSNLKLFSEETTLWRNGDSHGSSCPSLLGFHIIFPSTYRDGWEMHKLPPTYEVRFPGVPGLVATCSYSITVTALKKKRTGLLKRRRTITIPLRYRPRTRPAHPVISNDMAFLATIKTVPEEWHQVLSTMASRSKCGFPPIYCHLYIPAVQIFAFPDTIPFHLQLRAPPRSLRAFLHPTFADEDDRRARRPKRVRTGNPSTRPLVRVFLYRQIIVEVRGQKAWRTCVLGEGKLRSLPPPVSVSAEEDGDGDGDGGAGAGAGADADRMESLDWDGEVRCNEDVAVGGFHAGKLSVKDFIVLHVAPPCPQYSPLLEMQHAHPIKLVTDTYAEELGPDVPAF